MPHTLLSNDSVRALNSIPDPQTKRPSNARIIQVKTGQVHIQHCWGGGHAVHADICARVPPWVRASPPHLHA